MVTTRKVYTFVDVVALRNAGKKEKGERKERVRK